MGALITGAGHRLGAVFAEALAAEGFALALHSYKSGEACSTLAKSLATKYSVKTTCLMADLSKPQASPTLFQEAVASLGGLPQVVVANAALFEPDPTDEGEAHKRAHWAVNYQSPLALTRCYAEALRETPPAESVSPVIVLLGDATLLPARTSGLATYADTKEALMAQVAGVALEVAPALRVVALAPGPCLLGVRQSEAHFAKLARARPLQKPTSTEDLVAGLQFAIASTSLTGEILYLDGGGVATRRAKLKQEKDNYGIEIVSLKVPCRIGWTEAERAHPQTLEVSLFGRASLSDSALRSEDLASVINYSGLENLLREEISASQAHLLERLAVALLDAVFAFEPRLDEATLTLGKPDIRKDCASLGISLTRHR